MIKIRSDLFRHKEDTTKIKEKIARCERDKINISWEISELYNHKTVSCEKFGTQIEL